MKEKIVTSEVGQKVFTKDSACPKLSVKYRIRSFCICFILWLILSLFTSFKFLFWSITKHYKFAIIYKLGNILFYIIFTFFYILLIYNNESGCHKIILRILILPQYAPMFWYILSYILFDKILCRKWCKCLTKNNSKN